MTWTLRDFDAIVRDLFPADVVRDLRRYREECCERGRCDFCNGMRRIIVAASSGRAADTGQETG